MTKEESI